MEFDPKIWVSVFFGVFAIILTKLWDPIAADVGYPFGVGRRVVDLKEIVKRLTNKRVEFSYRGNLPHSPERTGWLESVEKLVKDEERIKADLRECSPMNYFKKCYIGREVDTAIKKGEDLKTQGDRLMPEANTSLTRPPIPQRDHGQSESSQELRLMIIPPGMNSSYNTVLAFIKNNLTASCMGVWGMGGVGKTELINLVRDSRSTEYNDYFSDVLLVQAGKGCNVADLQKSIAISMGLRQIDNEISQSAIIWNHLEHKDFLLLVDDLWDYLDLKAVGIPLLDVVEKPRRKVVFTSRSMEVCSRMIRPRPSSDHHPRTIQMKCLNKADAWNLFADIVGGSTIFDNDEIREAAEMIVEECSGLPKALCTIGKSMLSKKYPYEWKTTIHQLRKSELHKNIHNHEDLLKCLECLQESYDNVEHDMMKQCFLLCSLWPENESISMKKLVRWWNGLGLLDGYPNASDAGYSLINELVHKSMLEKSDTGLDPTDSHVKMHSMIRKMAIWIVNEHGYKIKWLPNSSHRSSALTKEIWFTLEKAWVSDKDTSGWCTWSSKDCFPRLKMFVARHVFSLNVMITCFQMITFLDLEGLRTHKFPLEICKLIKLQHLNLSATTITGVLPPELKELVDLMYLYLRNNMSLQAIPAELIFALKKLRGLDLFLTGVSFPFEESERSTIILDMLGFTVRTVAEITKLGQLRGVRTQALCMHNFKDHKNPDIIDLKLLSGLEELRELAIVGSSHSQKELVAPSKKKKELVAEGARLPCLGSFELNNLLQLETVKWKNPGTSITMVSIYKCDKLKDVTWIYQLKLLEQLTVAHCQEMKMLIQTGELPQDVPINKTNGKVEIIFPRLQRLKLEELPKLSMISEEACDFKELSYICVIQCNEMKGINDHKYKESVKIHCC